MLNLLLVSGAMVHAVGLYLILVLANNVVLEGVAVVTGGDHVTELG